MSKMNLQKPYLLWYKSEVVVVKCGKKIRQIYISMKKPSLSSKLERGLFTYMRMARSVHTIFTKLLALNS